MLLKLSTVSPQPPSAFWCAASQAHAAGDQLASNAPWTDVAFCVRARALTAVAVDRAEVESSPIQWPSGVRSARRAQGRSGTIGTSAGGLAAA